jgi:PAS domain S-box-containing protein
MPKFLEKKYINSGFVIALIILIIVNVIIYLNIRFHIEDEKIITETLQTIQTAEALYSKTVEASSNRRGYLITNNIEFMQGYYPAVNSMDSLFLHLKSLTKDSEKEKSLIDTLGQLVYNRKDIWIESLEMQEKHSKDIQAQIEYTKKDEAVQDRIKSLVLQIQKEENSVLVSRLKEAEESASYTLSNIIIGNIIAFILLVTVIVLLNRNITQRKQVEKTLEESRNWLATTLESIGDAVIVTSKIGEILFINKAAEHITGWKQYEAKGMLLDHVFNVIDGDTRKKTDSPVQKVISSGKTVGLADNVVLITKNRKEITVDESAAPIYTNGRFDGVVLVFRDVSERRRAEKDLLSSRKFIERIADSVPSIIYTYSLGELKINYVNYKISEFIGFSSEDVIKMRETFFMSLIHPEDLVRLKSLYAKYSTARDNEILDYEYRIKNSKGEWRWFRSYDVVFTRNNDGLATEMLGSALDITDKKKMEEELKKYSGHLEELVQIRTHELSAANNKLKAEISERARAERNIIDAEEKFRSLVENSLVGIYIIQDERYTYSNPKHDEIFGYSRNGMLGMSIWKVIPEVSKLTVKSAADKRTDNDIESVYYSYKAERKDGTLIDVEVKETRMQYNGRMAVIGTLQDITERKKSEDELNRQREYLRAVIDTDPNFVFAKDWEGRFTLVNKAVADVYGTTVEELTGKSDSDFNPNADEVEHFLEDDREVIKTGKSKFVAEEKVSNSNTGESRWYQTIKVPLKAVDGTMQVLGVSADITARKLAEEITQKSLHEKELLLKEIHHRVKNNLQIIVSLLKLQSKYITDPQDLQIFNSSRSRVETMSLIHEKLYKSKDLSDINLGNYVKDLVTHILQAYKINHEEICFSIKSDSIQLSIDTAIPCGLIINELVNNTLKYAFPEGHKGRIEISIKRDEDDIILEIMDNGIGIPETFDIASSDSLGLQLVETLIKQISGKVELDITSGTKFIIKFKEIKYRERI